MAAKQHIIIILIIIQGIWLKCIECGKWESHSIIHNNNNNNHHILYSSCPLNSLCYCAKLPNETYVHEISCHDVSLYKFPEFLHNTIKHIEMSKNFLQSVDDETFQGLRLESLRLVGNQIQVFSDKSFNSMTHSIISLDISGNLFHQLPLNSIRNIHTLSRLNVQRNYIENLEGDWGNLIESLRSLHLSHNSITDLLSTTITTTSSTSSGSATTTTILSSNGSVISPLTSSLTTIIEKSSGSIIKHINLNFPSNSNVNNNNNKNMNNNNNNNNNNMNMNNNSNDTKLYFYNEQPKLFSQLKKLIWLNLSENYISFINSKYLPKQLITLDLSNNLFQMVPKQLLDNLQNLKILSLRDNLIKKLNNIQYHNQHHHSGGSSNSGNSLSKSSQPMPAMIMQKKLHLEKFDLSLNCIDELPSYLFNTTVIRIKSINFEKNFIKIIPQNVFRNINGVLHLIFAFNRIEYIEDFAFNGLEYTLEYLDLEHNQLKKIPIALELLTNLRYLYLSSNQLNDINIILPNRLHVLSLSGNNFTFIPFSSLHLSNELTYLNLGNNKIIDIQIDGFLGWGHQLQTLLLRNNKITRLNYDSFNGLDSIKEISLSFNDIHFIHPQCFENISKTLKILELSFGIYRDDFPMEQLKYLTELIWLSIDNNNLKTITNESLATMRELNYINLSFNRLPRIPLNLFQTDVHQNLIEIDLSYNLIRKILPKTFSNLLNLQFINLQSNRITQLEQFSFYNLPMLNWIDLTHNLITNIADNVFSYLPKLIRLDLMHNQLNTIKFYPFLSNELKTLHLNISNNNLIEIQIENYLKNIHTYDYDFNNNNNNNNNENNNNENITILNYLVPEVDEDQHHHQQQHHTHHNNHNQEHHQQQIRNYNNFIYITLIDANHNSFSDTKSFKSFYLTLRTLFLSFNNFTILPTNSFNNFEILEVLNISDNRISQIARRSFQNLHLLQILDLSSNYVEQLQSGIFSNLHKLRILYLTNNKLKQLPSDIFLNTRIEYINLNRNHLQQWPIQQFSDIGYTLRNIQIGHNHLKTLDSTIFLTTQYLNELNLSDNNFTVLPDNIFLYLNNLTKLNLGYNLLVTTNLNEILRYTTQRLIALNLSGMSLYTMPQINTLIKLMEIDLSENYLIDICSLENLKSLRALNLYNNKITNLTNVLNRITSSSSSSSSDSSSTANQYRQYTSSLDILNIGKNPIHSINLNDFYHIRSIKELYLTDIKCLINPMIFIKMKYLKILHIQLQYNLGDIIEKLPGLRKLYIKINYNNLNYIQNPNNNNNKNNFNADNHINNNNNNNIILDEYLFEKFENNTKLELLEISGGGFMNTDNHRQDHNNNNNNQQSMNLKIMSNTFYGLRNNHKLKLIIKQTNIQDFPAKTFYNGLSMISQLTIDLSDNRLQQLSPESFYPNSSAWDAVGTRSIIGGLDLFNNRLQCDCGLVWLGHWLRRWLRETAQINVLTKDEYNNMLMRARRNTCIDPLTGINIPFLEIFPEDLLCHASALSSSSSTTQNQLLFYSIYKYIILIKYFIFLIMMVFI